MSRKMEFRGNFPINLVKMLYGVKPDNCAQQTTLHLICEGASQNPHGSGNSVYN